MVGASSFLGAILGWVSAGLGVIALRLAWRHPWARPWLPLGWGLLATGLVGWSLTTGADVAVALGLLVPSLIALVVLAASAQVRRGKAKRPPRAEVELAAASGPPWRVIVRTLYAGPLAALAAVAIGAAVALHAPMGEADRLIAGGLLVPMLWAGGMIWATTDARLARIGLGLTGASLVALAVAAL